MVEGAIQIMLGLALAQRELVGRPHTTTPALPLPLAPATGVADLLDQAQAVRVVFHRQLARHCCHC